MNNHPTPAEIRAARKAAGLTQAQAAALVGVNDRGWRRYEAGDVKMPVFKYQLFLERTGNSALDQCATINY